MMLLDRMGFFSDSFPTRPVLQAALWGTPEGSQLSFPSGNNFQLLHPHVTFLSFPAFWGTRWSFSLAGASAERFPLLHFPKIGSWEAETQLSPHHITSTPLTLGISRSPNVGPPAAVCGIWGVGHIRDRLLFLFLA